MKPAKLVLTIAATVLAMAIAPRPALAQGRPDFANMDPQKIQEFIQKRMVDNCREQLAITNDADWSVIEERLTKVVRSKMDVMAASVGGMMRMGRGPEGGRGPNFGLQSPETQSLQTAVDNHAPAKEIKAALAKFRESQAQKEADLRQAQNALREVITLRQEAILVSMSMLD